MELDGERDLQAELGRELVQLGARAQDRPLGGPDALGGVELHAGAALAHAEDTRGHEPVGEAAGEAVDGGPHVDRAAELVEERPVLGWIENREGLRLLLPPDQPSRHTGGLERRRALGDIRPADENALAPEQPRTELLLEPLPLSARPNREPNEPLLVMPVPKHPRATGRLPRPGSGGLEADELNPSPLERVGRGEPGDPTANHGDVCCVGAHAGPCIPPRLESEPRGAVAQTGGSGRSPKPQVPGSSPGCPASTW